MTLELSDLRGCEDGEKCERHRALAGQHQRAIIAMMISCALASVGGNADWWPRWKSATRSTDVYLKWTPDDYTAAFVFKDAVKGKASDRVIRQYPMNGGRRRDLRWTLLWYESGRLAVRGDVEAFYREFWREYRAFQGLAAVYSSAESPCSVVVASYYPEPYNRHGQHYVLWTERWRVLMAVGSVHVVGGDVPEQALDLLTRAARFATECPDVD